MREVNKVMPPHCTIKSEEIGLWRMFPTKISELVKTRKRVWERKRQWENMICEKRKYMETKSGTRISSREVHRALQAECTAVTLFYVCRLKMRESLFLLWTALYCELDHEYWLIVDTRWGGQSLIWRRSGKCMQLRPASDCATSTKLTNCIYPYRTIQQTWAQRCQHVECSIALKQMRGFLLSVAAVRNWANKKKKLDSVQDSCRFEPLCLRLRTSFGSFQ